MIIIIITIKNILHHCFLPFCVKYLQRESVWTTIKKLIRITSHDFGMIETKSLTKIRS